MQSFHRARMKRNYAELLECCAPGHRPSFDRYLVQEKKLVDTIASIGKLIRGRVGQAEAKWFLERNASGLPPSPFLRAAGEDGHVDWTQVEITVNGDRASARIQDMKAFAAERIDGKWHAVPREPGERVQAVIAMWYLEGIRGLAHDAKKLEWQIAIGKINKRNFWVEMWEIGLADRPGSPTAGVSLYLAPDNGITYPKRGPLKFRVIVWAQPVPSGEDVRICWRVPKGGLGDSITLELDDVVIRQPRRKADQIAGIADDLDEGLLKEWWTFALPGDLALRAGLHTLRYTVTSPGGDAYIPPHGKKVPILKGKLVSNTLRFMVADK